jgi:hypothetical protein
MHCSTQVNGVAKTAGACFLLLSNTGYSQRKLWSLMLDVTKKKTFTLHTAPLAPLSEPIDAKTGFRKEQHTFFAAIYSP